MIETSKEWVFVFSFALVILMKIVCIILGYFIIRLGYQLIASGVKGEFKFSATLGEKFPRSQLRNVETDHNRSPGLTFVRIKSPIIDK